MEIARPADPLSLPALTLAYLGDTVYDLYVRTLLAETLRLPMRALHLERQSSSAPRGRPKPTGALRTR